MTPRERVENVLSRREADKVPFTIYEGLMPRCTCERKLRDDGLCLVSRSNVFSTETPNVKERSEGYYENGVCKQRWFFETPHGTLTRILVPKPGTTWHEKKLFSSPDDYKAILFMIEDQKHKETYADFIRLQQEKGDDYTCRTGIGYEPLQEIITNIMGVEIFSIEWMERQDEVLKIYEALVEQRRRQYRLVAQSPSLHVNYGGNVSPEIVGLERFKKYYIPNYEEAAEEMHKHGKLIGVHLDANNRLFAPEVAKTALDYIEAFTPPPDCDLSVKEALEMWPNKVLWINFPSSVHIADEETIRKTASGILKESVPGDRLLIGITEDVPQESYQKSLTIISEVINKEGLLPIK